MKYFWVVSILMLLSFTGCSERIILVPQAQYYPTFHTNDFNKSTPVSLIIWEQKDGNNTYLVADKENMIKLIKDTKNLRSNYNILLEELIKFNLRIRELNRLQGEKKPTEIK